MAFAPTLDLTTSLRGDFAPCGGGGGGLWVYFLKYVRKCRFKNLALWGVQLTKLRNVDLTTDGLWAMPLNTRWVLVKARVLQDWEN